MGHRRPYCAMTNSALNGDCTMTAGGDNRVHRLVAKHQQHGEIMLI